MAVEPQTIGSSSRPALRPSNGARIPSPEIWGGAGGGGLHPTRTLRLTVNHTAYALEVEPRELLLHLLRDRLGLTGVKNSCDVQVCGACTVLVDGVPVSACCTLAYEADGKAVETIEGLAEGGHLHPIQAAFVERGALQCGFCTPGMVLSVKALLAETPHPTRPDVEAFLGGNLCRCTGYWNILAAVEDAARRLAVDGEYVEAAS